MKKIIIALVMTVAMPAFAGDTDWKEICGMLGNTAENTMKYRQDGKPMSVAMKAANNNGVLEQIVQDAYDIPRYSNEIF